MKYIQQIAQNFGKQLIKPRKYNYSQQLLQNFLIDNLHLNYKFTKIQNKRKQLIQILLVQNNQRNYDVFSNKYPYYNNDSQQYKYQNLNLNVNIKNKTCIIYAHGLGSNKLQSLPLLKYFMNSSFNELYDICSFDFSGSGKSQGKYTSYGLRQQDDICAILSWLDNNYQYQNYILWGRSMGSVAIILSQGLLLNSKVKGIVLDSPFSSFQKICLQIASKKSFIPQIFLQPLLSYLKQYFDEKAGLNPFNMNILQKIKTINRKILFVYSKSDSIVNHNHSLTLKLNCSRIPTDIIIPEDHNMQRSKCTFKQIQQFIEKVVIQQSLNYNYKVPFTIKINNQSKQEEKTIDFDITQKFQNFSNRRGSSRNRGISLTTKDNQYQKENLLNNANKVRKSTGGTTTKINLMITQSATLKRNDSMKVSQNPIKLKPVSSVTFSSKNKQNLTSQIIRKSLGHPLSVPILNSMETIQSNCEQEINKDKTLIKNEYSFLDMTQKLGEISLQIQCQRTNKNIIKHNNNKGNSFHLSSFLNQDLNMVYSINSICANKKKNRQKQQSNNTKEKEKIALINVKRPSIQLRRKNRFVV